MLRVVCLVVCLAAFLFGAAACRSGPDSRVGAFEPIGAWRLVSIEGQAAESAVPPSATPPTLLVEPDGSVSGMAGINHFSSRADPERWRDGEFVLREIITTEMAGPPAAMRLEQRFLDALSRVDGYLPGSHSLELLEGTRVVLRFARVGESQ